MSKRLKGNLWIALAFFVAMGLGEKSPALGGFGILACIIYAVIFNRKFKKEKAPANAKPADFELDENGNFKIISFAKNPMSILVKLVGKPRREVYKIIAISIDKKGDYLFYTTDEFNKEVNFYYYETASLITYDGKAYHTFDDLVLAMTNKSFFKKFEKLRCQYLQHIKGS
ncbi:hypothetical protein [Glaesserella parasuis]|uniref:hypothetical protein n=1 Tax=Glaesserella parasuis TaxID=738 RepID=UPI0021BD0BCE|nr:hypothetical protein [Glaesserella parasuis]MCT8830304.1 hypothetical protein [Glaesserella parasuis]MCT8834579.1 hypothetical protein [Glaesserella parasuis]MDG6450338.1 hypothetical protein [Glaesserella parasuis]MDO9656564.1 hypothetical protein [Glaesserella parasuis]MDO9716228.1 hypothetical protein [Glaesserella parasuis]